MDTTTLLKKLNDWAGTEGIDFLSEDIGLSACFKWLVPKLAHINIMVHPRDGKNYKKFIKVEVWTDEEQEPKQAVAETPALALCLAILRLIEQDVDNINK